MFERIDVLGVTDYTFTLTAHAKARGWDAAFGAGILRLQGQCGRGERSRAEAIQVIVHIATRRSATTIHAS